MHVQHSHAVLPLQPPVRSHLGGALGGVKLTPLLQLLRAHGSGRQRCRGGRCCHALHCRRKYASFSAGELRDVACLGAVLCGVQDRHAAFLGNGCTAYRAQLKILSCHRASSPRTAGN